MFQDRSFQTMFTIINIITIIIGKLLLPERNFRSDNCVDNCGVFPWARKVHGKSRRLSLWFRSDCPTCKARSLMRSDCWPITIYANQFGCNLPRLSRTRKCKPVAGFKCQAPAAHWNVHDSNWVLEVSRACRTLKWTRVYITQPPVDIRLRS